MDHDDGARVPRPRSSKFVDPRIFGPWMELDGAGWSWMELDGAGWSWMELEAAASA